MILAFEHVDLLLMATRILPLMMADSYQGSDGRQRCRTGGASLRIARSFFEGRVQPVSFEGILQFQPSLVAFAKLNEAYVPRFLISDGQAFLRLPYLVVL